MLADPDRELDDNARADIAKAHQPVTTKHEPRNDGQVISELPFGGPISPLRSRMPPTRARIT
ncbi:MAG: hypothetical protein HYR62_05635 [Actinobacteria bacterium]|nr:hypothetical protein [Actinomycetota bacterium]MBI3688521.1 hypothetical protein [Actinomycetota bacterium]